ncbi:MAG: hypothetical protein LBH72_03630 [Proteiniphilum sp.]|jgi:hypothetical protein|nr:hypothetical protein [Proteiniphilum sp.]
MNKKIFCTLLIGALLFSAGTFVSCNDKSDDTDTRLSVIEGMMRSLEGLSGLTIASATQVDGIWTLELSDGQKITIDPSIGGGSASLDVEERGNSIVITVNGTAYELPLSAGFYSLVYVPEFIDGEVRTNAEGEATARFLVKPALTDATFGNVTFSIGAAQKLDTRSSRELFGIKDGSVAREGDYISMTVRATDASTSGLTYGVVLQMTLGSSVYLSNSFNLAVSGDYTGMAEAIVPAQLIADITDYVDLEDGFSTATLPSTVDPLGTFNFKDLFTEPGENVRFELGARASQNDNVTRDNRYDVFRNALAPDGTWELKARPGTNGDAPNEDQQSGILVNVIVDNTIVHKIYWKITDPVAAIEDAAFAGSFGGGPHIEYPQTVVWEKGAATYDFNKKFTEGDFNPMHDGGAFVNNFKSFSVKSGSNELIYNDGEELQLGDFGKKLAKFSRGLYWRNIQSSVAASERRNLDIPADQKKNGEIIDGYDGITTDEMWNTFGFRITDTGLEMSDKYGGNALRVGVGLNYEYAYGERSIGNGVLVFLWINRRVSPPDVTDPDPR